MYTNKLYTKKKKEKNKDKENTPRKDSERGTVHKKNLINEIGDVQCMLDLLGDYFNISSDNILEASTAKREKLKKLTNLIGDK